MRTSGAEGKDWGWALLTYLPSLITPPCMQSQATALLNCYMAAPCAQKCQRCLQREQILRYKRTTRLQRKKGNSMLTNNLDWSWGISMLVTRPCCEDRNSTTYESRPYKVVEINGSSLMLQHELGHQIQRNAACMQEYYRLMHWKKTKNHTGMMIWWRSGLIQGREMSNKMLMQESCWGITELHPDTCSTMLWDELLGVATPSWREQYNLPIMPAILGSLPKVCIGTD